MPQPQNKYDNRNVVTMELVYGEGFMSPGGADEVVRIVEDVDLSGATILDLGCGLGGASIALAAHSETCQVTGIDIEPSVLARAGELVTAAGQDQRVKLKLIEPGPLPFPDQSFDIVYANSVSCHIAELGRLFSEIRRVLAAGGLFLGSEWFVGPAREAFRQWDDLLRARGLNFYFVQSDDFSAAIVTSGLEPVVFRDRTEVVTRLAEEALIRVTGELREPLLDSLGTDGYQDFLAWSRSRTVALTGNGMLHCHFRARK